MSLENFFSFEKEFPYKDLFEEIEFPWEVLLKLKGFFEKRRLGKIEITIPPSVFLENPKLISIGKGTKLEPGVFIKGPCVIGENCSLRHGAYIRDFVILGDHCTVGHGTEVKHSIFLPESKAAHFAYVGDSILGSFVNLGAGVKCANLRFDLGEISTIWNGSRKETGLKKFGSILGDFSQVGCNAVLNPGTLMGKHSICFPSLNIGGEFSPHSKIFSKTKIEIRKIT